MNNNIDRSMFKPVKEGFIPRRGYWFDHGNLSGFPGYFRVKKVENGFFYFNYDDQPFEQNNRTFTLYEDGLSRYLITGNAVSLTWYRPRAKPVIVIKR